MKPHGWGARDAVREEAGEGQSRHLTARRLVDAVTDMAIADMAITNMAIADMAMTDLVIADMAITDMVITDMFNGHHRHGMSAHLCQ